MLVQYIRDKERRPIGCMVAWLPSGNKPVIIGVSLCNVKKDKFDKVLGRKIATARAIKGNNDLLTSYNPPLPNKPGTWEIAEQIAKFGERACKYFRYHGYVL